MARLAEEIEYHRRLAWSNERYHSQAIAFLEQRHADAVQTVDALRAGLVLDPHVERPSP